MKVQSDSELSILCLNMGCHDRFAIARHCPTCKLLQWFLFADIEIFAKHALNGVRPPNSSWLWQKLVTFIGSICITANDLREPV